MKAAKKEKTNVMRLLDAEMLAGINVTVTKH